MKKRKVKAHLFRNAVCVWHSLLDLIKTVSNGNIFHDVTFMENMCTLSRSVLVLQ